MTSIAVPFLAKMGQGSVKYKHRLKNSEDFSVLATPHRTGIGQKIDRGLFFLTDNPAKTHNLPIKTEKSALRPTAACRTIRKDTLPLHPTGTAARTTSPPKVQRLNTQQWNF
jgi:hypothetical protein